MPSSRPLALIFAPFTLAAVAAAGGWTYSQEAEFDSLQQFGANCGLGHAVALDGDTALVGVPHPGAGGVSGAAVVYRRVAGTWTQEATLAPSDGTTADYFGWSVALEGDTAVVGANGAYHQTSPGAGAVYVYARSGSTWTERQKLTASDPLQSAEFGWSVSISGTTLVAGAPQATYAGEGGRGAAYVFDFNGATWTQTAKLAGSGTTFGARSGSSVAIDVDRLVIGARTSWEDGGQTIGTGSAWVFKRTGGTWSEEAKLQSSTYMAWALFGSSAAIEGKRIVVGAEGENSNTGAAYVFDRVGSGWVQKGRLTGAGTDGADYFGRSVDVSGHRLAVGAPNYDSVTPQGNGCVKVFDWNGAQWTEHAELLGNPMYTGDTLGDAVAIQADTLVGGSPSLAFGQIGRAWMWHLDLPIVETYCTAKVNSQGCAPAISSTGTPSASSPQPFDVDASLVINKKWGFVFYGTNPYAAPFQGGYLCVEPFLKRTTAQWSNGSSTGTDCTGGYAYDFNALIQSGTQPILAVGADVYCQYWYRDPASPSTTGLTDALHFRIQP